MKKVNEFIYNPALTMGIGMMPLLIVCTSLKNAIIFGAVYSIILLLSYLLTSAFKEIIVEEVRIPCFALIIFASIYFVDSLVNELLPNSYEKVGALITYIFASTTAFYMLEMTRKKESVKVGFGSCCLVAIEYFVSMILIGGIREFLSCGKLYDKSILSGFGGIEFFSTLLGGTMIVLFVLLIYNKIVLVLMKQRLIDRALLERYEEKKKLLELARQSKESMDKGENK